MEDLTSLIIKFTFNSDIRNNTVTVVNTNHTLNSLYYKDPHSILGTCCNFVWLFDSSLRTSERSRGK